MMGTDPFLWIGDHEKNPYPFPEPDPIPHFLTRSCPSLNVRL